MGLIRSMHEVAFEQLSHAPPPSYTYSLCVCYLKSAHNLSNEFKLFFKMPRRIGHQSCGHASKLLTVSELHSPMTAVVL